MPIFGLAIAAIAAILVSGNAAPLPESQSTYPIRVISSSHQIDFPHQVVFRLEAEAAADITEVTLFYRLGRRKTRVYGYPDFQRARRVRAEFRVKTDGASYIPSGVDIEYYYVIRDAQGHALQSPRFQLEYKDPAFRWRRLRQGDLVVLWHDRPRERVAEIAEAVSERLQQAKDLLGLEDVTPKKAVILNGSREAEAGFPFVSEAARRGHLYGGFAFGELDVFVLVGLSLDGMVHEMVHLLMDEAMDSPLARVPAWLNEGLAMYFESTSRGREATVVRARRDGVLMPLRSMANVPGRPRDVVVFYAQSSSVVQHMMDGHGPERMASLLRAINKGRGIDEAVTEAYGMNLEELELEWGERRSPGASVSPAADLGTVGTSLIIAGAVAVAAIAILLRWLRRASTRSIAGDAEP